MKKTKPPQDYAPSHLAPLAGAAGPASTALTVGHRVTTGVAALDEGRCPCLMEQIHNCTY